MLITNATTQDYWFGPLVLPAGIGQTLTVDDTSDTSLYLTDDVIADQINTLAAGLQIVVTSAAVPFPRPVGDPEIIHGDGSPEGLVYAAQGSTYVRRDATGVYQKTSGRHSCTGWQSILGPTGPTITTSTLSGGPPSSPQDGDLWFATGIGSGGQRWQFQYDASEATASKWKFVGGAALTASDRSGTGRQNTVNNTWEIITGMPSITIVRAGQYQWRFGGLFEGDNADYTLVGVGVPAAILLPYIQVDVGSSLAANLEVTNASEASDLDNGSTRAAADVVYACLYSSAHTNVEWFYSFLSCTPIRIS